MGGPAGHAAGWEKSASWRPGRSRVSTWRKNSAAEADQVQFFAGSATEPATPVGSASSSGGAVETSGPIAVGNLNSLDPLATAPGVGSRMIRGIVDEITLHDTALTLEEIVRRQTGYRTDPQDMPVLAAEVASEFLILTWDSEKEWTLQSSTTGSNWLNAGVIPQRSGDTHTVFLPVQPGRRLFRLARWDE